MQLEDRYYTSTEVAEILGVSLRSVYRYMEDNKLLAEIKTATGRHRFTRQNIIDFLYPDGGGQQIFDQEEKEEAPKVTKVQKPVKKEIVKRPDPVIEEEPEVEEAPAEETVDEEPVDWLAKFREAANKYKEDEEESAPAPAPQPQPVYTAPQPAPAPAPQPQPVYTAPQPAPAPAPAPVATSGPTLMYYRSMLGGLKDVAQNLDKSARNSNLDYAFTLYAGASLHKPVKPFATLHSYIKSVDRDFFEKILRLTPANKDNAQLCLVVSDDVVIYNTKEEIHGLYVVAKSQLKNDIATFGESSLAQEMADVL